MSHSAFDITGQKVLVVGAGRGIGKGIALAFSEAGADVAVSSLSTGTVGRVADEIRGMGGAALPLTGDATKAADMDRIAAQVWRSSVEWIPSSIALATPSASRSFSFRVLPSPA